MRSLIPWDQVYPRISDLQFFFLKKRTLWARCIVQQDCTCVPRKSCAVHASCVFCPCSCRWTPESMLLLLDLDPLHTAVLWRCQPDPRFRKERCRQGPCRYPSLLGCKFLLTQKRDNYARKNTKAQKSSYCIWCVLNGLKVGVCSAPLQYVHMEVVSVFVFVFVTS